MDLMEALRFPTATSIAYWWWAFIASIVAGLAWWHVFKDSQLKTGVRLMYLGLALAWTGDALNKVWFGTRRLLDFPSWMLDSLPVLIISGLMIIGAAIHLHTFTARRMGKAGWISFTLLTLIAATSLVFW